MQELFRHPGWQLVLRAFSEKRNSALRQLISNTDPNEMIRAQGKVQGLEEAITVRDVLLAKPARRP